MSASYHERLRQVVGHVRRTKGLFRGEKVRFCDLTMVQCPLSLYSNCSVRPKGIELQEQMDAANNNPDFGSDNEPQARKAEREARKLEAEYDRLILPLCALERALGAAFDDIAREHGLNEDL